MERKSERPSRAEVRRTTPITTTRRRFWNYPRPGYRGLHRWLPSWRFMVHVTVVSVFLSFGGVVAAYVMIDVPTADAAVRKEATSVYFAAEDANSPHGELIGTYPGVKRDIVDTTTLPDYVAHSVVASEDQSFYTNIGVDPIGILRALINNLGGSGNRQGGSTLTQQYVERYYMGTTTDYVGKAKEALLAIKINQQLTKEQILDRYLNTIYFGRGADGIQAAAQAYFGVDAKDLTLAQAAVLTAVIPSPSNWDPAENPVKAEERWNRVLDRMVEGGWLTQEERDEQVFPETLVPEPQQVFSGPNGHLLVLARKEAATELGISEDELVSGGYTIVTTFKKSVQDEAIRAGAELMTGAMSRGDLPDPNLKIAMVTIDPHTGEVLALYSGQDFLVDQFNRVTQDAVQAGSTFKPFTLIAALEQKISLRTTYDGSSPQQVSGWTNKVTNFGGVSFGRIDLVAATENSVNTVYAQLNNDVGPEATAEVAQEMGVTTQMEVTRSNVLGTDAVHPLDMASAYGVLAAEGMRAKPHFVDSILDTNGALAYTASTALSRVLDADVAADAVYAMQQVVKSNSGSAHKYVSPLKRNIAGKTGTSQNNKSAWFIGFTPDLVTAVALSQTSADGSGAQDSITAFGGVSQVTGGSWPAALWANYMKPVLAMDAYSENKAFPARANVGKAPTATPTPAATATEEPAEPETVTVPGHLEGRWEADATAVLFGLGLVPDVVTESSATVPKGRVIRTEPSAGTELKTGDVVKVVVSSGPAPVIPSPSITTVGGGPGGGNNNGG